MIGLAYGPAPTIPGVYVLTLVILVDIDGGLSYTLLFIRKSYKKLWLFYKIFLCTKKLRKKRKLTRLKILR